MNGKEMSKLCGICGDKAHGYNFNAITCESCKAFFRRNALRKKDFKCPFEDKCKIDLVTRKFCKKCRLKKCFDIGMKKEWILSDEEKVNLRSKIAENRKKRQTPSKVSKLADSTTSSTNFPNVVQLIQNSYAVNNDKIIHSGCQSSQYEYNSSSPMDVLPQTPKSYLDLSQSSVQSSPVSNTGAIRDHISDEYRPNCDSLITNSSDCFDGNCFQPKDHFLPIDTINSPEMEMQFTNKCMVITDGSIESIKNSCIESFGCFATNQTELNKSVIHSNKRDEIPDKVYQKAIELEFAAIPIKDMLNNLTDEEFNRYESQKITELSDAVSDFNDSNRMVSKDIKITSEFTSLLDATKLLAMKCDEAIRRLVIMSKKISPFKNLCQHDQIALMKACCFEILIMRSVMNYNSEHEYWPIAMDQNNATKLKLDVFKQAKGNLYEAHKRFMQPFKQEWIESDSDNNILDLLTAIVLFTPDRPNIIHKEIIKLEQQTYMYLLQRYLISKYKSKCEAKMKFLKLMSVLEELHILHDQHVRIYLEVDPQDVGPLLIEILDLHPYNTLQIL